METEGLEDNWVEKLEMEGCDCVGRAGAHSYFPLQLLIPPSLAHSLSRTPSSQDIEVRTPLTVSKSTHTLKLEVAVVSLEQNRDAC